MTDPRPAPSALTRRDALKALAALGVTAPLAACESGSPPPATAQEVLAAASSLTGTPLDAERIRAVEPALTRNLEQFRIVRELDIDDSIEPVNPFRVTWR